MSNQKSDAKINARVSIPDQPIAERGLVPRFYVLGDWGWSETDQFMGEALLPEQLARRFYKTMKPGSAELVLDVSGSGYAIVELMGTRLEVEAACDWLRAQSAERARHLHAAA
jgi:hypothetical protein